MGPSLCGRNVFFRQIMTYGSSNIPVTTEVTGIFRIWWWLDSDEDSLCFREGVRLIHDHFSVFHDMVQKFL